MTITKRKFCFVGNSRKIASIEHAGQETCAMKILTRLALVSPAEGRSGHCTWLNTQNTNGNGGARDAVPLLNKPNLLFSG
ncbi:hypothetical protein [Pseudomonas sp. LB3P25]